MKLTKEKLESILEGLEDYLYNELYDAFTYHGTFNEKIFEEAYKDAAAQVMEDAEYNGDFEEK